MKPPDFSDIGLVTEGTWRSWAVFSPDRRYRYLLSRNWLDVTSDEEKLIVERDQWAPYETPMIFCMLNPSTASAFDDDPTIRKCIGFAKRQRKTRIIVANLFAWRATDPRELTKAEEPCGERNAEVLARVWNMMALRVAAWGRFPSLRVRRRVHAWPGLRTAQCFGKTKGGEPRHPLMLSYDTPLVPVLTRW